MDNQNERLDTRLEPHPTSTQKLNAIFFELGKALAETFVGFVGVIQGVCMCMGECV